MLANQRANRENASRTSHGSRRYSARASDKSSHYKDKAQQYYSNFNGKAKPERALSSHNGEPRTPQQHKNHGNEIGKNPNFYLKNGQADEITLKMKGLKYLDKKGVLVNKANKRYFKDNDLCEHLKVNKKQ
jgi:hypothetical protein